MENKNILYHKTVIWVVAVGLSVPIISTLVYSFASSWGATVLPDGFSLQWYIQLWSDPRFLAAFGRSMLLCLAALTLSCVLIVPTVFIIFYYYPKLDGVMNLLILIPFAVPPVVGSVGLLQLYSNSSIAGTPWLLVATYFTIVLPFMYRALANSIQGCNLQDLIEAAHLLGCSTFRAFFMVVLPNIKTGLFASLFLSFSFLLGEFVFANILVGTRWETLQVYLYNMRQTSGHFTSALVMSYLFFLLLFTLTAMMLNKKGNK